MIQISLLRAIHHAVVERHVLSVEFFGVKVFGLFGGSSAEDIQVFGDGSLWRASDEVNLVFSLAQDVEAEDHVLFTLLNVAGVSKEAVRADDVIFAISRKVLESETDTSRSADSASAALLSRLNMDHVVEIANGESSHHGIDELSDIFSATGLQDVIDDQRRSVDDDTRSSELLDASNQNAAVEAVMSEGDVHTLEGSSLVLAVHLVEVERASLLLDGIVVGEIVGVVASVQVELHLCKAVRRSVDHESLIEEEFGSNTLELVLELLILERGGIQVEGVKELLVKRAFHALG